MSDTTNPELMRAYHLIEEEDLEQARTLLDSYLERDKSNPDAWWLYVHAVTDPAEAQEALRNVLRLNPNYPGAQALLAETEAVLTPSTSTVVPRLKPQLVTTATGERVPDFLDQLDVDEDEEFDTFDEEEIEEASPARTSGTRPSTGNRRLLFILAPILLAVIILGGVVALINNLGNQPSATATTAAEVPTDTSGIEVQQTQETALATAEATADITTEVTSIPVTTLDSAFINYDIQSIQEETTSLGNTLIVTICNDPAQGLPRTALSAVDVLARESATLSTEYLAVRVVNCESGNTPLRTVGVSIEDAREFAAGTISATDFRSRLQPLS